MGKLAVLLCVFGCIALPAIGGVITLTFEGLQNVEPISNYYDGGFGGLGSGPGPNYGITFTSDSLALISRAAPGGTGSFSGSPTMPTAIFFLSGAGDIMDVPAGFDTGFSFYYSAPNFAGTVSVYEGVNGTGNLLTTLDLSLTPVAGGPGCIFGAYCSWEPVGVSFEGLAKSVVFSGTANYIAFDNITLGAQVPAPAVPEPSTIALLALALPVLIYRRMKKL